MMLQKANTNVISAKRPPMNPPFYSFLKLFSLKDRQAFEALLKRYF